MKYNDKTKTVTIGNIDMEDYIKNRSKDKDDTRVLTTRFPGLKDLQSMPYQDFRQFATEMAQLPFESFTAYLWNNRGRSIYNFDDDTEIFFSDEIKMLECAENLVISGDVYEIPKDMFNLGHMDYGDAEDFNMVIIENGVHKIKSNAFSFGPYIGTLILPDNIRLESGAFEDSYIERISFGKTAYDEYWPESQDPYTRNDVIAPRLCKSSRNLEEIEFRQPIQQIENGAFDDCGALTTVKTGPDFHDFAPVRNAFNENIIIIDRTETDSKPSGKKVPNEFEEITTEAKKSEDKSKDTKDVSPAD